MKDLRSFWGCANGPLKYLQPQVKIICSALLVVSCLVVPLQSLTGILFIIFISVCWCIYAAMPGKMFLNCVLVSFVLFFPYLLLIPWMTTGSNPASSIFDRIFQGVTIVLRSFCTFFIAASTIAALDFSDLHRGLKNMPIPASVSSLVIQIVNQMMFLMEETFRIIEVLRLRGASGVGGIRMLFSFPIVWMVRMLFRAERYAAAMIIRGYSIENVGQKEYVKWTLADIITTVSASIVFTLSIFLQLMVLL